MFVPFFFLAFTETFIPIKESEQRLVNMLSLMFFCWFYNYNLFFFCCNPVITHCLPRGSIISTLWLNFTMNLISETMLYTGSIVTIKKIAMFASELKRVRRCNKVATFQLKKNCVVVFQFIKEFLYGSECNYSIAYYVEALYSQACLLDGSVWWWQWRLGILIIVWFHCKKKNLTFILWAFIVSNWCQTVISA